MFDGISPLFILNTLIGIASGVLLIRYRHEVADIAGNIVGTRIFRDTDNPFTYLVLGWLFIIFEIGYLTLALFS